MYSLSEERLAPANGIELAYQEIGDPEGEPLLLVMGLAMQLLAWEEGFCRLLAERGFRVVRFDNRDVGHSTMIDSAGVPNRLEMLYGRRATAPYLLADMADDAFGLLDHLGIDSAHVVGASMGGMIAQEMAIRRPERVRSLVSMLSTTGNRWLRFPALKAIGTLMTRPPRSREEAIERAVRIFRVIGSPGYPFEEQRVREITGASYDRNRRSAGVSRQLHAINASGDRTAKLEQLRLATTVLHGERDPLVRVQGARATARAIRDSRLRIFPGMGHDLPRQLWPEFVTEIVATTTRAADECRPRQAV